MALSENDIFEHQLDIARTINKITDIAKIIELDAQIEFYEVQRADIISANNARRIALLQPRISRLEEIIRELGDLEALLRVKRFRKQSGVPAPLPSPVPGIPTPPTGPIVSPPPVVSPPFTPPPVVNPPPIVSPPTTPPSVPVPTSPPVTTVPVGSTKRTNDLNQLHPDVRRKVKAIQKQLDKENIPMRVFEAFRSPERQAKLYAKGRTAPGSKVTNAKPWQSYHQYGMAADFVRFENGKWNWNTKTAAQRKQWDRFHQIARDKGLEPLSWEKPHVQLIGTSFGQLLNGDFPDGGDDSWMEALTAAINRWPGSNKPPLPEASDKPAMPMPTVAVAAGAITTTSAASGDWHNMFGGDFWRFDNDGVYTRNPDGTDKIWRTPGAPLTVQEIVAQFGSEISAAAAKHKVPAALIVMTIATETAIYRPFGFTGPKTFRWEQGVTLSNTDDPTLDGIEKGDYSAGPMQVLSNTARWMNDIKGLGYDNSSDLRWFKNKPTKAPNTLGLYDTALCVDIGTAYLAHNMAKTGVDPILVAGAYNAGSLQPSSGNHWRIKSSGNHLDRAAEWYGDACAVLNGTA